jgi:ergothioneine biosynthesis protein EgtB
LRDPGFEKRAERYRAIRRATEALADGLSPEDCSVQSMEDASPVRWHLAHTTWFFETFLLERFEQPHRPYDPGFRDLFNSYYQAVGEPFTRAQRGVLSRPGHAEVLGWRADVDTRVLELLARGAGADPGCAALLELGLEHEQQHQELILTDLKHALASHPLRPVYRERGIHAPAPAAPLRFVEFGEGLRRIGYEGPGFAFDNELPRHRVFVAGFALASRLVTNAEFAEFVAAGGYRRPELWLSDGWAAVLRHGWRAPLYWEDRDGVAFEYTLSGRRPLQPEEPVCHVSFYEAEAYARFAGARLASEAEWEHAASEQPVEGNFVESGRLHPAPAGASPATRPAQLFGDVWEWTRSAYAPYPGYRAPAGALGEYNGKFMCNQLVLRGGSCVTPRGHVRPSYRNFFPPEARWQFSGIRLARDAGPV